MGALGDLPTGRCSPSWSSRPAQPASSNEVLWLKELGLLFGSTAYAASTTLAVFFLGLAIGGAVFGRRSPRLRSPLRAYAWLELGIAASALLYFLLLAVYFQLYGPLYDALADRSTRCRGANSTWSPARCSRSSRPRRAPRDGRTRRRRRWSRTRCAASPASTPRCPRRRRARPPRSTTRPRST